MSETECGLVWSSLLSSRSRATPTFRANLSRTPTFEDVLRKSAADNALMTPDQENFVEGYLKKAILWEPELKQLKSLLLDLGGGLIVALQDKIRTCLL